MKSDTFWEKWDCDLKRQAIPEKKVYYMKRSLEKWSQWRKDNPHESTRMAFEQWIESYASLQNVRDWQVFQAVRACELAHWIILNQAWAKEIDWDYWKYRFRELETTHTTVAGEFGRLDLEKWRSDHGLSGRRKEWLCGLFDELRQSRKALRTERTYLGWVRRFLLWRGEHDFAPDAGE